MDTRETTGGYRGWVDRVNQGYDKFVDSAGEMASRFGLPSVRMSGDMEGGRVKPAVTGEKKEMMKDLQWNEPEAVPTPTEAAAAAPPPGEPVTEEPIPKEQPAVGAGIPQDFESAFGTLPEQRLTAGNVADQLGAGPETPEFVEPPIEPPPTAGKTPAEKLLSGAASVTARGPEADIREGAGGTLPKESLSKWGSERTAEGASTGRFAAPAQQWMAEQGIEGEDKYLVGSAIDANIDPREYVTEKGKFNPLALKRELRNNDPAFIQEEWGAFKDTPEFKEEELDFRRYVDMMSRGGASFGGRPRIDAAAAYNDFIKGQREKFAGAIKRDHEVRLEDMKAAGDITKQEHEKEMKKFEEGEINKRLGITEKGKKERAEAGYEFTAEERKAREAFDRDMTGVKFDNQTARDAAQYDYNRGLRGMDIESASTARRENAENARKLAAMDKGGSRLSDDALRVKKMEIRSKTLADERASIRKDTGKNPEPGHISALAREFDTTWELGNLRDKHPGGNFDTMTVGNKTVIFGITADGKKIRKEIGA